MDCIVQQCDHSLSFLLLFSFFIYFFLFSSSFTEAGLKSKGPHRMAHNRSAETQGCVDTTQEEKTQERAFLCDCGGFVGSSGR